MANEKRKIDLRDVDPLTIIPHGDRLLLEVLDADETTASGIEIIRTDDKSKEHDMGWVPGLVINVGSGHRMDVPDQAVPLATMAGKDENGNFDPSKAHPYLRVFDDAVNTGIFMIPSTVPMNFARGMVVLCAKYAGSDIQIKGVAHKIITQSHVIGYTNLKLPVGDQPVIHQSQGCAPADQSLDQKAFDHDG